MARAALGRTQSDAEVRPVRGWLAIPWCPVFIAGLPDSSFGDAWTSVSGATAGRWVCPDGARYCDTVAISVAAAVCGTITRRLRPLDVALQ